MKWENENENEPFRNIFEVLNDDETEYIFDCVYNQYESSELFLFSSSLSHLF